MIQPDFTAAWAMPGLPSETLTTPSPLPGNPVKNRKAGKMDGPWMTTVPASGSRRGGFLARDSEGYMLFRGDPSEVSGFLANGRKISEAKKALIEDKLELQKFFLEAAQNFVKAAQIVHDISASYDEDGSSFCIDAPGYDTLVVAIEDCLGQKSILWDLPQIVTGYGS
jgi:hypothetical protein